VARRWIRIHPAARTRTLALLAVSDDKGVRLVCERSSDLVDVDAAAILGRAADRLGGRSGGTAKVARGGGRARPSAEVSDALRDAVA
jgi:alanyl-tRNA synthetase